MKGKTDYKLKSKQLEHLAETQETEQKWRSSPSYLAVDSNISSRNYILIRKVGSLNQMLGIYSSEIEARFIMNKCKKHYKGKIWYKMTITDITTAKVGNYLRKRNEKNIKRHEKQYTHIITENN